MTPDCPPWGVPTLSHDVAVPFPTQEVWSHLDPKAVWPGDWYAFQSSDQQDLIADLADLAPFDLNPEIAASSGEAKPILTLRFGRGKRRVLIWARQHGDEPECTAALMTVLHKLVTETVSPLCQTILDELELLVVPMVNPDGMDAFTRVCASGIDLNRDASVQATPEGQLLVRLKDEFQPEFAFNLHDMRPRKTTKAGTDMVTLAFQAGPFDAEDSDNETRLKAKAVIGEILNVVKTQSPHIARYDCNYMSRAFGDAMMKWGVACILIESGSLPRNLGGDDNVIRMHALALLAGLHAVATGKDASHDASAYDAIPPDGGVFDFDEIYRGGRVFDAPTSQSYVADLGLWTDLQPRRTTLDRQVTSTVQAAGDLAPETGKHVLDASGCLLAPGIIGATPDFTFDDDVPSDDEARGFLRAGITTIATAFGPFVNSYQRDEYIEMMRESVPPLNVVAFERVLSIPAIVRRHGITPFAGLCVTKLQISMRDLKEFARQFQPTLRKVIAAEPNETMLGLNVLFSSASSTRKTRLHLMLQTIDEAAASRAGRVDYASLHQLCEPFITASDQVSFSGNRRDPLPKGIRQHLIPAGFTEQTLPAEHFIARALNAIDDPTPESRRATLGAMTFRMADALRLDTAGALRPGFRGDVVFLPDSILDSGEIEGVYPQKVVLNGEVILDRSTSFEQRGRGRWKFAE